MKYFKFSLLAVLIIILTYSCAFIRQDKGNCGGKIKSETKRDKFLNALLFDLIIDTPIDSIAREHQKVQDEKKRIDDEKAEKNYIDSLIAVRKRRGDTAFLIMTGPEKSEYIPIIMINPVFKGGNSAFESFMREHLFVCAYFMKLKTGILTEIKFTVEKNGDVKIIRSEGGQRSDFDLEVANTLRKSSRLWLPARVAGHNINTEMTLKVRLKNR